MNDELPADDGAVPTKLAPPAGDDSEPPALLPAAAASGGVVAIEFVPLTGTGVQRFLFNKDMKILCPIEAR